MRREERAKSGGDFRFLMTGDRVFKHEWQPQSDPRLQEARRITCSEKEREREREREKGRGSEDWSDRTKQGQGNCSNMSGLELGGDSLPENGGKRGRQQQRRERRKATERR